MNVRRLFGMLARDATLARLRTVGFERAIPIRMVDVRLAHLDAVLGWARELNVGALYLTHLDNSMDHAQLVRELPDWAAPAWDGLEIEI